MSLVAKKRSANSVGSNELSRLLTRERLHIAGVRATRSVGQDPDLEALWDRVRTVTRTGVGKTPEVKPKVVKKLVQG
jgi:hypothetical protein